MSLNRSSRLSPGRWSDRVVISTHRQKPSGRGGEGSKGERDDAFRPGTIDVLCITWCAVHCIKPTASPQGSLTLNASSGSALFAEISM